MQEGIKIDEVSVPTTVTVPKGLETGSMTRSQRDLVCELSQSAFGARCRWQKLVGRLQVTNRAKGEDGKVVNSYRATNVDDVVEYMRKVLLLKSLPVETKAILNSLSAGCFSNSDAWKNVYLGDPRPVEDSAATFKELSEGMLKVVSTRTFVESDDEGKVEAVAEFFNGKDDGLMSRIPFVLYTKDLPASEAKLAGLDAALRDKIAPYLVTEFNQQESIGVDADQTLDFLLNPTPAEAT